MYFKMFIKFSRFTNQNLLLSALRSRIIMLDLRRKCSTLNLDRKIQHLLILDFEATCELKTKIEQEVIEFPCIKFNVQTLKEEARFHHYVRPIINPQLSHFCTELTGILQEMVDGEKTFPEVFKLFNEWRVKEELTEENSLYVTSGDWDLGSMMPKQCKISGIEMPSHMMQWIDIKKLHGSFTGKYLDSFIQIIKYYKMNFEGRQHSGIDDCKNILNVIRKMMLLGVELQPTSKLAFVDNRPKVESLIYKW